MEELRPTYLFKRLSSMVEHRAALSTKLKAKSRFGSQVRELQDELKGVEGAPSPPLRLTAVGVQRRVWVHRAQEHGILDNDYRQPFQKLDEAMGVLVRHTSHTIISFHAFQSVVVGDSFKTMAINYLIIINVGCLIPNTVDGTPAYVL